MGAVRERDAGAARIAWVDLAKATSVVLVVLLHTTLLLRLAEPTAAAAGWWLRLGLVLEPLRMPMFFTTSGVLAAAALARPWRDVRGRTWGMLYLAGLWIALLFVLLSISPDGRGLFATLTGARAGYWYLIALAGYFCIARWTRRVRTWAVLTVAAIPNLMYPLLLAATGWPAVGPYLALGAVPAIAMNLVFFLMGVRLRGLVLRCADRASWRGALPLTAVAVAFSAWRVVAFPTASYLPESLLWIGAVVQLSALAVRRGEVAHAGRYLGTRTLPVFVTQFPLLAAAGAVLFRYPELLANQAVQWLFPVAMTAACVVAALVAFRLARPVPWRYLFQAPPALASHPSPDARVTAPGVMVTEPAAELGAQRARPDEPGPQSLRTLQG